MGIFSISICFFSFIDNTLFHVPMRGFNLCVGLGGGVNLLGGSKGYN